MTTLNHEERLALNVGDMFYECQSGINIECTLLTKPVEDEEGGITFKAKASTGAEIDYAMNLKKYSAYAPRIYDLPQYVTMKGEGNFKFMTSDGKLCKKGNDAQQQTQNGE